MNLSPIGGVLNIGREDIYVLLRDKDAFESKYIKGNTDTLEKPLGKKERETLLTIIGVLAKAARIDITEPYKAGGVIASQAEFEGINLSARTTGDHLKLIPDILENRTKI